ncbi:hypothetical protein ACS5PN_08165 [Roseateles sp. NT4]|uniref:hypothetical protein n=1 Tax=Roseateles sp. NT4 TaxID=3453715 RepID=UPI003EEF3DCE
MFIVWGKKIVRRRCGFVADFCPICRTARPFSVERVGSASHVYYLSFGEGDLLGHERTCLDCNTPLRAEPESYRALSKKRLPLQELVAQTFPNLREAQHQRFDLEARIRNDLGSLSREDRTTLIHNPFLLLSPKVDRRFERTHIDLPLAAAILAGIALFVTGPAVLHRAFPNQEGELFLIFGLLGLALMVWQGIQSGRRFMRREVLPQLVRALYPLKPREHEVKATLEALRANRHRLGRRVKAADLMAGLDSYQPEPLPAEFAPPGSRMI